jgi:polar amino acid transport system substrate-binding protein
LIDAVEEGRADMIISGMTITPARTRRISFVGPYMLSGKSLLTTAAIMGKMKTSAEFDSSDIKLVALKGSTSESFVQQKFPKASLTVVANYDEGVQMLLAGKVNGMVADMPILALTRQQHRNADLQLITPPLSTEPLGIAIARGDEQFENLLRNYLLAFEKTGLFVRLHKKWFEIGNHNLYEP